MFRENVGLLAMTKIGSRRVIQISAAFMIFFSIFGNFFYCCWCRIEFSGYFLIYIYQNAGKFGAFFASIPLPIMASVYCIVLCFVCKSLHHITLVLAIDYIYIFIQYICFIFLSLKIKSNSMQCSFCGH